MGVKSGSVAILIKPHVSYQELYDEMYEELQSLPIPIDIKTEFNMPQGKL